MVWIMKIYEKYLRSQGWRHRIWQWMFSSLFLDFFFVLSLLSSNKLHLNSELNWLRTQHFIDEIYLAIIEFIFEFRFLGKHATFSRINESVGFFFSRSFSSYCLSIFTLIFRFCTTFFIVYVWFKFQISVRFSFSSLWKI